MKLRVLISAINESSLTKAVAALNEQLGDGDWIRIAPFGEYPNKVGLQVLDVAAGTEMVKAFNSLETKLSTMWRGLPIYEGHPDDADWARQNPGVKKSAVGRVKKLEARADGVWGFVAWNELGEKLVHGPAPAYTAQSPHWGMLPLAKRAKAFQPVELWSLGLTNQPNIAGTHMGLNEADDSTMKKHIIALLAALGRPVADAAAVTDEQLATAVNEAVAPASAAVAAANKLATVEPQLLASTNEVATLKGQLSTLTTEREAAKTSAANERQARANLIVQAAINEGRATEAQRADLAGQLVAASDFDAKAKEIAGLKKAINTKSSLGDIASRKSETDVSKVSAINEAVQKHMADNKCDHHTAFLAVKKAQPALFGATSA